MTAHHVDHGLRPGSAREAERAVVLAERLGADAVVHRVDVAPGPNLEARARAARYAALPPGVSTGHTADDQAETVLVRLLRGAGATGLSAMEHDLRRPLLGLRRHETHALCHALGLDVIEDPTNRDPAFRRNRVRAEVLPLLDDVAGRDVVPLLARTASLLRDDDAHLTALAGELDPTDAASLVAAPLPLARRAIRTWLTVDGYPPDAASVERVLDVAHGRVTACELAGGRRVARTAGRLRVEDPAR